VKLDALHGNMVPTGVTILLGLCIPPYRGRGESAKPGLLYPFVWIPYCDHGSMVLAGVIVLLGLCIPPCRGRGESAKPGLWHPFMWIPCCDIVIEKAGSQCRVGSIASDLEY
jgi:hypothetical protein